MKKNKIISFHQTNFDSLCLSSFWMLKYHNMESFLLLIYIKFMQKTKAVLLLVFGNCQQKTSPMLFVGLDHLYCLLGSEKSDISWVRHHNQTLTELDKFLLVLSRAAKVGNSWLGRIGSGWFQGGLVGDPNGQENVLVGKCFSRKMFHFPQWDSSFSVNTQPSDPWPCLLCLLFFSYNSQFF